MGRRTGSCSGDTCNAPVRREGNCTVSWSQTTTPKTNKRRNRAKCATLAMAETEGALVCGSGKLAHLRQSQERFEETGLLLH